MKAEIFTYEGEGIQCVFDNKKWVVCIKNWKPNNNIDQIQYLEIHYQTDEQFVLLNGKAILLAATREKDQFQIDMILMEPMKVYNVPQGTWFNTITERDTKLIYVQDAGTSAEPGNSEYINMTQQELQMVREKAATMLSGK